MSLLEDIFLQDEANEAQELERVIEGGDYEERAVSNSDNDSEKEDEAEEDKRRVDPSTTKTKSIVKNPRFVLNPARLTGPRGIQVIPEHFKDFKFKGKGHEKEDLDLILKKLEHWAYRLYPKFKFEDCLKKIETLGKKRPVMVHLHKIRSDQLNTEETVVQKDSSDDEDPQPEPDEFDKLLQQQIELARTPAPSKNLDSSQVENRPLVMPKPISSPSISDEQRERMLRNRKLAEERRLARLKNKEINNSIEPNTGNTSTDVNPNKSNVADKTTATKRKSVDNSDDDTTGTLRDDIEIRQKDDGNADEIESQRKKRKTNIIDSSDESSEENVQESITVDVHSHVEKENPKNNEEDSTKEPEIDDCDIISNYTDDVNEQRIIEKLRNKRKVYFSSDDESDVIDKNNDELEKEDAQNKSEASKDKEAPALSEIVVNKEIDNASSNLTENNSEDKAKDRTTSNSNEAVRDIVLENNIIQSTIQGLVENDNNLNLERDLINKEQETENRDVPENEDLMDVDLSEDF